MFRLTPSDYLTQNEIEAASLVRSEELNTQQQARVVWPPAPAVARAYVDQLLRSKAIQPDRAKAITRALESSESVRTGKEKNAAAVIDQLDALSRQLDADAAGASGRDAARMRALASTIRERAARLRG